MKKILPLILLVISLNTFAQSVMTGIPDSVQNVSYPGSTGQYTIANPLNYSGTMFGNVPTTVNCINNCKSDYLYFYDVGLAIPTDATITGVQVIHTRGGCNSGSYDIDTLHLAANGIIISDAKRDSTASGTDTLGSVTDTWNAVLTPDMVNSNSFGLFVNSTGTGICTFGQFSIQLNVYYTMAAGIKKVNQKLVVHLSPNPAAGYLHINLPAPATVTVTNLLGQQQTAISQLATEGRLNVSGYTNGIYFISAQSGNSVYQAKFIVAH